MLAARKIAHLLLFYYGKKKLFLQPIRKEKLLNHFEIVSIFSNIEKVKEVNTELLKTIEKQMPNPLLGDIFNTFSSKLMKEYAIYCSNQPNVRERIIDYKAHSDRFTSFLKATQKKAECRKLDLESFLIMPLQRLCKYPLILKEYQKSLNPNQAKMMQSGLNSFRKVVDDVNSRVKQVENLSKLMQISTEVSNGGVSTFSPPPPFPPLPPCPFPSLPLPFLSSLSSFFLLFPLSSTCLSNCPRFSPSLFCRLPSAFPFLPLSPPLPFLSSLPLLSTCRFLPSNEKSWTFSLFS